MKNSPFLSDIDQERCLSSFQFLRGNVTTLVDENALLGEWKTKREQEIVELAAQVSQLNSDRLDAQNSLLVSLHETFVIFDTDRHG